ncbi:MAG: hypothetical protein AABY42_10020 [Nitrospirota bacterium]
MRRSNRVLVYLSFVLLFISPFFERTISVFLSAPSKETRAVVSVNEGRGNTYALSVLKPDKGFVPSFSLALALKREGHYAEAIGLYRKLAKDLTDPAIHVNLGNLYYATGDTESAVNSYLESLKVRPLVSAYYNLSQIRRESFDFAKGDEYFLEAAGIDHQAVSRLTLISNSNPNRFVADEVLHAKDVWEYAMTPNGREGFGFRDWMVFAAAITLAITFYFFDNWVKLRAYRCKRCGEVVCSRCNRALTWGGLCPDCYRSFIRMDGLDPRERVSKLLSMTFLSLTDKGIIEAVAAAPLVADEIIAPVKLRDKRDTYLRFMPAIVFTVAFILSMIASPLLNGSQGKMLKAVRDIEIEVFC